MKIAKSCLCVLVAAMASLSACRDDVHAVKDGDEGASIPCQLNGECPDGMLCKNLVCVTNVCTIDTDCPGVAPICVNHVCTPQNSVAECTADGDCSKGQICDSGNCVANPDASECTVDGDCSKGQICDSGNCVAKPNEPECTVDADCSEGQICDSGNCVPKPDEPECTVDADCSEGQICDSGNCVAKPDAPECTADLDCGDGNVCTDGICMPGPKDGCKKDSDCPGELVCYFGECLGCGTDSQCPDKHVCRDNQCVEVECKNNKDCPEKSICWEHNQCKKVECTQDAHCPELHICQNHACTKVDCMKNADCPGDQLCASSNNVCCDTGKICNTACCEYEGACFGGICSPCKPDETVCVIPFMEPVYLCCASDELCINENCIKPGVSCYDNYACSDGQYCALDLHTCIPRPSVKTKCKDEDLPSGGAFEPHLLFHWGEGELAPGGDFPDHINVVVAPMVADINGDTMPEIVFNSWLKDSMNWENNGVLRIISGKDGKLLASSDGKSMTDPSSQVAIGRLYPEDVKEYNGVDVSGLQIITCSEDYHLVAYNHEAKLIWKGDSETEECGNTAFGLVDFDGDGVPEVHARYRIYNAQTGKLIADAENDVVSGANYAIAADIDNDGKPELIGGNVAYRADLKKGTLTAVYHRTDQPDGYPAIADLDLDGKPEIVVTRKTYHDTSWGALSHTVMAFKHDGTDFWSAPVDVHQGTLDEWGGGPATIARIDDDEHPSVMLSSGTHYLALDYQGKVKWSHKVQDKSSRSTGSAVFDFNGDGKAEILYGDELFLRVYDGAKGDTVFCLCNTSATLYEYPVVADVNNDGHAEIVLASNRTQAGKNCPSSAQYIKGEVDACIQSLLDGPSSKRKGSSGVRVYSGAQVVEDKVQASKWMPTRRIYNQHAYSVTNILDDGTIPAKARINWKTDGLNNFRMNTIKNAKDYEMHFELYSDSWLHAHECREKESHYFSILNDGLLPIPAGTVIQADVYEEEKLDKPLQTYFVKTEEVILPGKRANMHLDIETPKQGSTVSLEIVYHATESDICRMESEDSVYLRGYFYCYWK